jgi:hypothetical protein
MFKLQFYLDQALEKVSDYFPELMPNGSVTTAKLATNVLTEPGQVLATVNDTAPASPGTWQKIGTTTVTAEDTTETTVYHWLRTV